MIGRRAWVVLFLVLAARFASAQSALFVSPGPLAKPHASLTQRCEACHVPFKGVPDASCLSCHEHTRKQIETKQGFHASTVAKRCAACHADHKGGNSVPTPTLNERFDHKLTGYVLDGAHRRAACASCHKAAPRWLGAPKTCDGCHADTHHKGALGSACAACHTNADWKPRPHHATLPAVQLSGGHAKLSCGDCHQSGKNLKPTSTCGDCHKQKHGGTSALCASCHNVTDWKEATFQHDFCSCRLPGKHQTAPCLSCHPSFKWKPTPFACIACHTKDLKHEPLGACSICHSAISWQKKVFNHNKTQFDFPLAGKHLELGCENCHKTPGVFKDLKTVCASCHAVPKHGDFGTCDTCHTTSGWKKTKFEHGKTRFPLDEQHATVRCEACHAKLTPGTFQPGPNACGLCHGDPHNGQFAFPPAKAMTRPSLESMGANASAGAFVFPLATGPALHNSPGSACLDCHTRATWKPSTIGVEQHQRFAFPLRESHAKLTCARCHADGRFVATPIRCASCHVDRHRDRLGDACDGCHNERSFSEYKQSFDHAMTGFVRTGKHAALTCARCHGEHHEKLAQVRGAVTCATCHSTSKGHGAQFGADCASCHQATTWSDVPRFDHTTQTDFPLERRHATLGCLSCHDARRGQKAQRACQTCHGDPHRASNGVECGDCHQADRWRLIRYDHDRTEFPLYGRHFSVPCASCHRNPQWYSTRMECVTCHAKDRPRTMDHASLIDCAGCHTSFSWRTIAK